MQHNGLIEILRIENQGDHAGNTALLSAQFVHYPDCQQLQVWLPKSDYHKWDYGNYQLINTTTNSIEEHGLVQDKVGGSIEMLFDTLSFPEGYYLLKIEHPKGATLCLHFQKYPEDFIPEHFKPKDTSNTNDSMRELFW